MGGPVSRGAVAADTGEGDVSHASLLVALDPTDDIETAIAFQMEPFDENDSWFQDGSRWDWYQIGGRSTGRFAAPGYDPHADPRNIEVCWLCHGTGVRPDMKVENGCNGCRGTGQSLKWPTDWAQEGNVTTRALVGPGLKPFYAFLRNRVWHEHERMGWWGGTAATECELAGTETHICTHEKDGARIVSWNGSDSWDKMFYPRFVEPLPPETVLVTVDYHV